MGKLTPRAVVVVLFVVLARFDHQMDERFASFIWQAEAFMISCVITGQARLVMRQRGNLKLLLNANLFPEMTHDIMDGGKVSFPLS